MSLLLRSFIPKHLNSLIRSHLNAQSKFSFRNFSLSGIKRNNNMPSSFTKVSSANTEQMIGSGAVSHDPTEMCSEANSRGIILGIYADPDDDADPGVLTPTAWYYNNTFAKGRLYDLIKTSGPVPKNGEARLFFGVQGTGTQTFAAIAVVGLGRECSGYNSYEVLDEGKEAIRRAAAAGVRALQAVKISLIEIESFGHAESAAEGAALAVWIYQELKMKKNRLFIPQIDLYAVKDSECDTDGWRIGIQKAAAQNLARQLQDTPANLLTPTSFAQTAVEVLCKSGVNVEVKVSGWAESQNMNAFLAVAKASCETPIFLELSYYGGSHDDRPVVLVGQGVTFDSGGLNVRTSKELRPLRGDMTGAAIVVAACRAIAALRLPLNIRGLIPLCENTLGCNAFKPGDIYRTMSGKCVEVVTTDNEGVLVLLDALLYAQNFCPKFIIDIGCISHHMHYALDGAAAAVFTNSEILWQQMKNSSIHTGCRVWRFPLWEYYSKQMRSCLNVDVQNVGIVDAGQPCQKAAFLNEFVPYGQWMHIEVSNVMTTNGIEFTYLQQGMAGRPTRTIVEFLAQIVCLDTEPKVV